MGGNWVKRVRKGISPQSIIRDIEWSLSALIEQQWFQPMWVFQHIQKHWRLLQETRIANVNLLLPVPLLLLGTPTASTCPEIPTEWRSYSLQGTALDFITFFIRFVPADPCLPLPAVSQHRPLGPAVFTLQGEQWERTIPSVSPIPNVLCYILLCTAAPERRR